MQKHMTALNIRYLFEKAICNLYSKFSLNKGLCQVVGVHDTTTACQQRIVEQMYIKCSLF